METELIESLLFKFGLSLNFFLLGNQELIKTQRVNRFYLLFEYLGNWVALTLKQMHQVHDLLLSKLQVCDFILERLKEAFEFDVLPDEHVDIFDQLLVLSFQVVLCNNFFLIIALGFFLLIFFP